ncbi:MAG: XRE family transcriptional regulator [Acidobacteriaceae bacterium]
MALNPQVLAWARDKAGLSAEDAAAALGFKDARDRTALDRLLAIESGREEPSRSVLLNMARKYHRSLLVFYLPEPPLAGDRGQDFRRAPGVKAPEFEPTLDALIRDIRGRQMIVKDLLEQTDSKKIDFVGSATMDVPPSKLAGLVAERIGFSLDEFRQCATVQAAFSYLRGKVEDAGAFVLLLGNLGSHHTNIPSVVFRGYAIADAIAPFVVINDQDAQVAWSFTVLHELTHLWLGTTGVSGEEADTQLEIYCNSVAGEILLPEHEMSDLRSLRRAPFDSTVETIAQFANERKISRAMVAYKLLRIGAIPRARWEELREHYNKEWEAKQARKPPRNKEEGGPNYYVVKRHRLGHALLNLVGNSLAEGLLTHSKAGQVLGVKPRNVDPLIHMAGTGGRR